MQLPSVLATNLVWATDQPSSSDIRRLLSTLRCAVDLGQVFTIPDDGDSSGKAAAIEEVRCFLGLRELSLMSFVKDTNPI